MPTTIEVDIDPSGHIHPVDSSAVLPVGRAILVWPLLPADHALALLSERSLAADWLRPEEDAAWAHLQPDYLQLDK